MGGTPSPQAFSQLIGSIYDCTLDPPRWDQTLAELRDALDCLNAVLSLSDLSRDRFLIYRSVGIAPEWQAEQAKHVPEIHSHLMDALADWPSLDMPHVTSRHLPPGYADNSR